MVHIKVKKGLDIPIQGKPEGGIQALIPSGESSILEAPAQIALDFSPFEGVKFRLLTKVGDSVKLGQPLAEDKDFPGRMFVAPASGTVLEVRRGLKRRLLDIVIEVAKKEEYERYNPINLNEIGRQELIEKLKTGGLFARIRQRPFDTLANPTKIPRSIFVKAIETAPFVPPAELQVAGYEKEFQVGLEALVKLTDGPVHLVHKNDTTCRAFLDQKGVQKHTVEGPHPAANVSVHIQNIDPIRSPEDVIWTFNVHDVVSIGYFILHGRYFVDRIVSIAGPGIIESRTGYFRLREGYPIDVLLGGRLRKKPVRLISGDVLTGRKVESGDFLGFYDYCLCAVPEDASREFLHFMRLGRNKYTFSGAYLSGHRNNKERAYSFTTSQHGEHRPFIESSLYDEVMPLNISTMHLVKAVLAEDYDLAAELGLAEVASEDFSLPTFVCPSKIEMDEIIRKGLQRYSADVLK